MPVNKHISIILCFIFCIASVAQTNLVPNYSFEEYKNCPDGAFQMPQLIGWHKVTPTQAYPAYLHACSTNPISRVPYAGYYFDSYQWPRTGGGMVQSIVYGEDGHGEIAYFGAQLREPLKPGSMYYIELYTVPDETALSIEREEWLFIDAIGLAFSDTLYYDFPNANGVLNQFKPAIENREEVIRDTMNWTRISGCYQATGDEECVIVGNFQLQENTLIDEGAASQRVANPGALYYFDDISVVAFNPLPDSALLCADRGLELNGAFRDGQVSWTSAHYNTIWRDSILMVEGPGVYYLSVEMDNCVLRDTVVVVGIEEIQSSMPQDTFLCAGERLALSPGLPGDYNWHDGDNSRSKIVDDSGIYSVEINNLCGEYYFSTDVTVQDCDCGLFVPSAFSPNADAHNDYLQVFYSCDYDFRLDAFRVFDRWGNQVYFGTGEQARWDGSMNGRQSEVGVYVWVVEYSIYKGGQWISKEKYGDVTLVR